MAKKETPPANETPQQTDPPAEQLPPAKDIHEAKLRVMAAVPYIRKTNQEKKGVPYSFLSEQALTEHLHEQFVVHGITVSPGEPTLQVDTYPSVGGKMMNRSIVKVPYTLRHVTSGSECVCWGLGEGADTGDKASPKCMTQCYKYMLRQTFMIETGDDPDKDDTSGKHPRAADVPAGSAGSSGAPGSANGSAAGNGQSVPTKQLGDGPADHEKLPPAERKHYNTVCEAIRKGGGPKGKRGVMAKFRRAYHERNFSKDLVACLEAFWWSVWNETPAEPCEVCKGEKVIDGKVCEGCKGTGKFPDQPKQYARPAAPAAK